MFGTIANKAFENGLFWGFFGSLTCANLLEASNQKIRTGGAICALTGVLLTFSKPAIYTLAKAKNLEDYKIRALEFGATQAIHALGLATLYATSTIGEETMYAVSFGLAMGAVVADSSLAYAINTWGREDKKIIESNNYMLSKP